MLAPSLPVTRFLGRIFITSSAPAGSGTNPAISAIIPADTCTGAVGKILSIQRFSRIISAASLMPPFIKYFPAEFP
jgi:hypothetical protein